ncbi:MAG: stage II sporulation protein M [Acidobacteriota bacterium]
MDYGRFVEMHRDRHEAFARDLEAMRERPHTIGFAQLDDLATRYRVLLHDYAVARERFAGTAATRRLRRLTLNATQVLQRAPADHLPSLGSLVRVDVPRAIAAMRSSILAICALFTFSALLGYALTVLDPALGATFVGPDSVEGLRRGEIWIDSVFAELPAGLIAVMISINNMKVALFAWAGGLLLGVGALYAALINGVMLGAVIALTARFSMEAPLLDFIGAHGPLEITLILVAAGAGLHMGRSFFVDDERPRSQRLAAAGREALLALAVCLLGLFLLGFIEGYVSPSIAPTWSKWTVGLVLEALFLTWVASVPRPDRAARTQAAGAAT